MSYEHLMLGDLPALLRQPDGSRPLMILAHGAGAPMTHAHMQNIADTLSDIGIGTLRFNFPYMVAGKHRVDNLETCLATFQNVIAAAAELTDANLLLGGHSFGGRMASHFAAARNPDILGLVYFSFPLHVAKKPATKRAEHLPDIKKPMLFVSGDRDDLADSDLLKGVVSNLANAKLHWLETADHSFKILKRTRLSTEDVYHEAGRVVSEWLSNELSHTQ